MISATLFVLAVLAFSFFLYRFNQVVFIFIVAVLLGIAIRPAVNWLNRRGLSRQAGVIVVYALLFSLVVGLVVLMLPLFTQQMDEITADLPMYYNTLWNRLLNSPSRILQQIAIRIPPDMALIMDNPQPATEEAIDTVVSSFTYVNTLSRGLLAIVAVFVLGFYWTLESERSIRSLLLWIPSSQREAIREVIAEIEEKVGGFLLGQGALCLAIGGLALIAYLIIGLPYALLLAVMAGILEAVPLFGPILGAVPAVLVAFSTDPQKAVWVIVATIIMQGLENYLLVPRIMKRSVGVNPLVTLLALTAFTSLLGLAGALLAIPLAAIVQLLINRFLLTPATAEDLTSEGRDQLSRLSLVSRDLALDVRKQLRENERLNPAELQVVERLESIANELALSLQETQQEQVSD